MTKIKHEGCAFLTATFVGTTPKKIAYKRREVVTALGADNPVQMRILAEIGNTKVTPRRLGYLMFYYTVTRKDFNEQGECIGTPRFADVRPYSHAKALARSLPVCQDRVVEIPVEPKDIAQARFLLEYTATLKQLATQEIGPETKTCKNRSLRIRFNRALRAQIQSRLDSFLGNPRIQEINAVEGPAVRHLTRKGSPTARCLRELTEREAQDVIAIERELGLYGWATDNIMAIGEKLRAQPEFASLAPVNRYRVYGSRIHAYYEERMGTLTFWLPDPQAPDSKEQSDAEI